MNVLRLKLVYIHEKSSVELDFGLVGLVLIGLGQDWSNFPKMIIELTMVRF